MMPILKFLETVTMNINSKNRTRLYSLCQVLLDVIASYAILCASLYGYHLCGASYHMTICLKLVYVPFVIVAINALSRVYGKNLFYPGIDISRVEELKRVTLSVIAGWISTFLSPRSMQSYSVGLPNKQHLTLVKSAPCFVNNFFVPAM